MCVSQLAKKAINWHKKGAKKEMEMKEISSFGCSAFFICFVCFCLMGSRQLCVYSHLFVLSRFPALHMDRCFPFHRSVLELDRKFVQLVPSFTFSLLVTGDYMACVMTLLCSFNRPLCNSFFFLSLTFASPAFHLFISLISSLDCFWQFILGLHQLSFPLFQFSLSSATLLNGCCVRPENSLLSLHRFKLLSQNPIHKHNARIFTVKSIHHYRSLSGDLMLMFICQMSQQESFILHLSIGGFEPSETREKTETIIIMNTKIIVLVTWLVKEQLRWSCPSRVEGSRSLVEYFNQSKSDRN